MRILFFFFLLVVHLCADKNDIPDVVLDAIMDAECLKDKGIYNPHFIRINTQKDILTIKNNNIKISGPYIRCENPDKCSDMVKTLVALEIDNIDMGPFQINYMYQNERWSNEEDYQKYFVLSHAEDRAREILQSLIRSYGYSWRTIGRYHHFSSKNKERNRNYYRKVYTFIHGVEPSKTTKGET